MNIQGSMPSPVGSDDFWGASDVVRIGRNDISDFNPENILPESEAMQASLRRSLAPTQYDGDGSEYQAHMASRLAGTGNWVFDLDIYQQWRDSAEHGILWIRGIPGSGKSVLASTLIHHLSQPEAVPVLYFFFRHTFDAQNTPEALLRDWLAQVLRYSPPLQHFLRQDRHLDTSLDSLWQLLRRALMYLPKVYCVIDALDEIDSERLELFLRQLDLLGQWRPAEIKVVVTSRPLANIERILSRGVKTLDVRLGKKYVQDDITRYVQHRMEEPAIPPGQREVVASTVIARADGLFLYAKLALDSLHGAGATTVAERLENIPQDLTQIYNNILREHALKTQDAPTGLQETVLQLVTHTVRPLRLLEIAKILQLIHPHVDLLVMKTHVRSLCGPLLDLLPDQTIRIVRHSLTEYLKGTTSTQNDIERPFTAFEAGPTHHRIASLCLSYLASGCLDGVQYQPRRRISGDRNYTEPARLKENHLLPPFTAYAATFWPVHVRKSISAGQDPSNLRDLLDEVLVEPNLDRLDVYAATKMDFPPTPLHFAIGLGLDDYARHLLSNRTSVYVKDGQVDDCFILYAAKVGNQETIGLLLDRGANLMPRDERGYTPLHLAVLNDDAAVAATLLDAGADPNAAQGKDNCYEKESGVPWSPMERVLAKCSLATVRTFITRLKDTEVLAAALCHSVANCNIQAVKQMLAEHPQLDVNRTYNNITPLLCASSNWDVDMVELLLSKGASVEPFIPESAIEEESQQAAQMYRLRSVRAFEDPDLDRIDEESERARQGGNTLTNRRSNALHAWAKGRPLYSRKAPDEKTLVRGIHLLLRHGSNVHQLDRDGNTPLHLATDAVTLRCLLEAGADPDALNAAGDTLLHESYNPDVVDILVRKANLELKTRHTHRTPLLSALVDGYTFGQARMTKATRLIEGGAHIRAVDKYGNSALHLALSDDMGRSGDLSLVKLLCTRGADVNLQNFQGKAPLHMNAPWSGRVSSLGYDGGTFNKDVLQVLLAAGADINRRDKSGKTMLFQYLENVENGKLVEEYDTLVRQGARADTRDAKGRSLLHAAVYNKSLQVKDLQLLVDSGLDPMSIDHEGNSLLHEAAPRIVKVAYQQDGAQLSILNMLTALGVDPAGVNHAGQTPFHFLTRYSPGAFDPCASSTGYALGWRLTNADDATGFDAYLRLQPSVADLPDKNGVRPLHIAATFSEYMTKRLLEEGADPMATTTEGLTPLHLAARSRQANIVGILLDKLEAMYPENGEELCRRLSAEDNLHRTLLYYAAASGRVEIFQQTLHSYIQINHQKYEGSAWNGCADFELEARRWKGPKETTYRLFNRKDFNITEQNAGGILLSESSQPNPLQVVQGSTAWLERLPSERLEETLEIMVSHAGVDQMPFLEQAITSSADRGLDYTVHCLVAAKARLLSKSQLGGRDIQAVPDNEKTKACLLRWRELARSVPSRDYAALSRLLDMRQYDEVAARIKSEPRNEEHLQTIRKFMPRLVAGGFTSLLSIAAWTQNPKHAEEDQVPDFDMKPLMIDACRREIPNMPVIQMLVDEGHVVLRSQWAGELTPLHVLAAGDHWWQYRLALDDVRFRHVLSGTTANAEEHGNTVTPLGYALRDINGPHFNLETVQTLLRHGASPNGSDRCGEAYLSWTIKHPDVFKLLVQYGAVIGRSALQAAIVQGDVDLVEMMLSGGADPNERKVGEERPQIWHSDQSFSPRRTDPSSHDEMYLLDWMAETGSAIKSSNEVQLHIFNMLIAKGADPLARYAQTTVLHRIVGKCVGRGSVTKVLPLLLVLLEQPGLTLESRDANGLTLLLAAVSQCYSADKLLLIVCEKLLSLGADVEARDNAGRSVLHFGTRSIEQLKFFIDKAPRLINATDDEGNTPLLFALTYNNYDFSEAMLRTLLAAGADVTCANNKGMTALHYAMQESLWGVSDTTVSGKGRCFFDILVSQGADVNARTRLGETPVFSYLRRSTVVANEYCVWDFFQEHGMDLFAVDNAGKGLLHVIAEKNADYPSNRQRTVFKILMGKGLDPSLEDKEHRTPLDIASAYERQDLLDLFKRDEGV